jgi:ligand-binding sensor domain-containing protein/signal transduction histidine kinase
MRKSLLTATFLLTWVTTSCGLINPTVTPNPPSSASFPGPQTATPSTGHYLADTPYSQNIRFEQFSLEEGLSQSVVNVVMQDSQGFLWVGTEDGLNRYDGYNFKIYKADTENPNSLSDRWITAIVEDSHGYLWIGTRLGGLNRYDPQTGYFTHFLHDTKNTNSISHNHVTALSVGEDGIWIGTEDGLDFLDYVSKTIKHFNTSSENAVNLSGNWVSAIISDPNGNLWIGTQDAGLNFYNPTENKFTSFKHYEDVFTSISSNRIMSIMLDSKNNLWVGTANGLNFSETKGRYFNHFSNNPDDKDSLSGNTINTIYQDESGGIWIGTNNGLNRYEARTEKFIRHQHQPSISNSLSNDSVFTIYEDTSYVLWVGTFGGGLNKYNRQQDYFSYYRTNPDDPNSLSGNFVVPIVVGENGTAWIGASGSGLNRFNAVANQFRHYEHDPNNSNSLSTNEITALMLDSTGTLWIGNSRGLDRLNPDTGKFTHFFPDYSNPGSISGSPVYTIYEDHTGIIWVGTDRGLDQFEPQSQTFVYYEAEENTTNSFKNNQVTTILEDHNFNFWIGTFDDGLKRFNPNNGEITGYLNNPDNPTSVGSNSILSLYIDHAGTLWIGTTGGGLNRYEPETDNFTRFTEKDGLPNNVIYGILEDSIGNLWLSTNFGISRFDPLTKSIRNFTTSDGLQSNEFTQSAFAKDNKGNLYFGGINGFNVFSPNEISKNPVPPKIVLKSLTQDGNSIAGSTPPESLREITLQWPQNSFEFEFTALAYGQPTKNQYAYTLENFETNWNRIGTQRNGRYTNLPGGTYTLRLLGSNSDGIWNNEGRTLKITVIPPFWVTWWFRSLLVLFFGVMITGGYRWRVKSVEGRNRDLERLVKRRTSDLEKRTSEIEALYQADERILRNVTLIQVFQTLVDVSVSMLKADRSVVFAWSAEQNKILPRVSHGFRQETLFALNFEEGEGLVGQTMLSGEPIIVSDVKLKELRGDIQTVIRNEGIQSFAHFPIVVDGVVIAVFNVAYTRPNALNDETVRLFSALVTRAALSIANMQLFEQTKDLAVMEERNRLARDLHDSAKQKAFAALAQLGTANGILKTKPDEVKPHLNEAETLVYEVIQELTFLIQEIYPIALQEKGLPTTLREYVFEWENRNDAVISLTVQNERRLPLDVEQAVYRFVQEALANVSRHSKAKQVEISLVYNIDSLQIVVADDGIGFDMNQKAKGMGFRSMRERIGGIRGTIQVQSAPEQGTRVTAQLPIKG